MNGPDAVYKIAGTIGQMLTLTPHSSAYPITAYAIAPCATSGVPSCTGNVYATDTTPVTITIPATTDYFIIVDGGNAALSGAYSLDDRASLILLATAITGVGAHQQR